MPTPTKGRRLGGSPSHEKLMMANLATSLFEHGRITTTEAKAKRVRPLAEKLITKAKNGDLHNRRQIQKVIRNKSVVHKLMAEIGPFYEDRNGGYTRITRTPPRQGDNAAMAVIELVSEKTVTSEAEKARGTKFAKDQPADDAKAAGHAGADAALAEPVGDAGAAEESDGESAPEADASESDATVAEDTSSEESEEGENKKDES